jgi:hypothetical protein
VAIRTVEDGAKRSVTEELGLSCQTLFKRFADLYSVQTLNQANNSTMKIRRRNEGHDPSGDELKMVSGPEDISVAGSPSEGRHWIGIQLMF